MFWQFNGKVFVIEHQILSRSCIGDTE